MTALPVVLFSLLGAFFTFAAGWHFGINNYRSRHNHCIWSKPWHRCDAGMMAAVVALCCWILAGYSVAKVWP